jgi:hypothetical protein
VIEITYQLSEEDFRHGLQAWQTRSSWRKWNYRIGFGLMAFLFVLGVILIIWRPTIEATYFSWFLLGLPAVYFLSLWLAPRMQARLQYRRMPSAQVPVTVTISDTGLKSHSQFGDSTIAWSAYIGWAEAESVFVLFPQPRLYVPIPKRALDEAQLLAFREILQQNVGANANRTLSPPR